MGKFGLDKKDYVGFKAVESRYRKGFRGGWHPSTLADDSRSVTYGGHGVSDESEFREVLVGRAPAVSVWNKLDFYVEAWFEARAMSGQFRAFLHEPYRISLRPFAGDLSIAPKWDAAELIRSMKKGREKVIVLYFGDADTKGLEIPENAIRDIRPWSKTDFEFHVGGLTVEQAERFGLPENFEKPGQYQWEALGDAQAHEVIEEALRAHVDVPALQAAIGEANSERDAWLATAKTDLGVGE